MSGCRKYENIDALKTVLMILVVLGHAITAPYRVGVAGGIWEVIYSFHMFFFFVISGFLFENGREKYCKDKWNFTKNKFRQLMFPYISITVIVYAFLLVASFVPAVFGILGNPELSIGGFFKALFTNHGHFDTHLWYIYRLFFLFLISILLPRLTASVWFLGLCFIINLFPTFFALTVPFVNGIAQSMIPFILGRLLRKKETSPYKEKAEQKWKMILFISVILFSFVSFADQYVTLYMETTVLRRMILQGFNVLEGILGSIALYFIITKLLLKIRFLKRGLEILSPYGFDVYLIHQPFIVVGIVTLMSKLGLGWWSILLTVPLGILISVGISKFILRKIKPLRIFILGEKS